LKRIILDLDNTLCDFIETWLVWLYSEGYADRILTLPEVTTYDFLCRSFGKGASDFYLEDPHFIYGKLIQPYEGSKEFVEWCKENFDEVSILSHADTYKNKEAKSKFVKYNYGITDIQFSNNIIEKYNFTKKCILVDDYPYHILQHINKNNNLGICINLHNNGWSNINNHLPLIMENNIDMSKFKSAGSYEEIKQIIKECL
jgi:hypothetical protein